MLEFVSGHGPYAPARDALRDQVFDYTQQQAATAALKQAFLDVERAAPDHKEFKPEIVHIAYSADGTTRTITFQYKFQDDLGEREERMTFTCTQRLDDFMTTSAKGTNLSLTDRGRGETEQIGSHVTGENLNNAHVIANWFHGSGYRESLNLMTTSDTFNQETMGDVEDTIADIVRKNPSIKTFDMEVHVEWGDFLEDDAEERLKLLVAEDAKARP